MQQDALQQRQRVIQAVIILGALLLIGKAFQLQVWDKSYQQQQSYRQALTLYPSRGLIYDRNGELLVYNMATHDLMATYERVTKSKIDTAFFCNLLNITKNDYKLFLEKDFSDKRFSQRKPFEFMTKIPAENFATFEEHLHQFPGFEAVRRHVRGYPINTGAHLLGYISEVSPKQIKQFEGLYQQGDYIGASGLELFYEPQLRGVRGVRNVLKDKWGKIQGSYKNGAEDRPSQSGFDLVTSIDLELQQYAELLMQNKVGAVVAIEPSTGEILAIVSSPSYDPSLLSIDRDRKTAFSQLTKDSLNPLFNRALMAKYPPGSIFKTIMAAIALQEGVITPEWGVSCGGGYSYGNLRVGCHGHPAAANVAAAIQFSCNSYFCQSYREIVNMYGYNYPDKGLDRLVEHLYAFGLGRKLGVDVSNEVAGGIPTTTLYNKKYGKGQWKFSNGVSVGIGQGELEITPLQMANIAAIIANRGFYYIPHFAREFKGDTSDVLQRYKERQYTLVHPMHFEPIVDGMERVVIAGTGKRARIPDITVCGKTGTVENPHGKDHSTFIAFAPKDNPKIAIAVYVENGGFGATYGAPIASLIIEKYLRGEIQDPARKVLENSMIRADLIGATHKTIAASNPTTNNTLPIAELKPENNGEETEAQAEEKAANQNKQD